ncbi:MAG: hypothetical protein WCC22_05575 [Terriglobales bacterium]
MLRLIAVAAVIGLLGAKAKVTVRAEPGPVNTQELCNREIFFGGPTLMGGDEEKVELHSQPARPVGSSDEDGGRAADSVPFVRLNLHSGCTGKEQLPVPGSQFSGKIDRGDTEKR